MDPRCDFDAGLSQVERLEVFIASPFLQLMRPVLPAYGMTTKPSAAEPAALLVVGAATLICGSDRAADRELAAHWERLRPQLLAAGLRVPNAPVRTQQFRHYRDEILGGGFDESFKSLARDLSAEMAMKVGLFPAIESPWLTPRLDQVVSADGTWFKAASEVRDRSTSRARTVPRVVLDADPRHSTSWGYNFCILSARGPIVRQRVMLDVAHAAGSDEMRSSCRRCLGCRVVSVTGFGVSSTTERCEACTTGCCEPMVSCR